MASISGAGLASATALGLTNITALAFGVSSAPSPLQVGSAQLVSIAITPTNPSVTLGLTQQYTAIGTYTDGGTQNITSSVTWVSSDTSVATINSSGLATGVNTGATHITAALSGITSNTSNLTILPVVLVSIAITPTTTSINQGSTQQYTAMGTYSNGTTVNITGSVSWLSSNPAAATINSSGLATGITSTTITPVPQITASLSSITSNAATLNVNPILTSIAVTPPVANVPLGDTQQFTATGTYSDGSTQDLTTQVIWIPGNPYVVMINSTGLATPSHIGTSNIYARLSTITSPAATFTTITASLLSIAISPVSASIPQNGTQQYQAIGSYSDGSSLNITSSVTWNSSNTGAATINSAGLATGIAPTDVTPPVPTITATKNSIVSNNAQLTVTPIVTSVSITPTNSSVLEGATQQFTAIAHYSDGATVDVTSSATWNTSNSAIATINASGLATGILSGSSNISATFMSFTSNSAVLTVAPAIPQSITLTPSTPSVFRHATQQFTATANYSGGGTEDITAFVTSWSSTSPSIASINSSGLATALSYPGTSNITASYGGVTSNAAIFSSTGALYIIDTANSLIVEYPINGDATLGSPASYSMTGLAIGQAVNPANTYIYFQAYIPSTSTSAITYCALNADGTINTANCNYTQANSFIYVYNIAFNPAGTIAYVTDLSASTIYSCVVNSDGSFGTCTPNVTYNYASVAINPTNTFAYIGNLLDADILYCPIQGDGSLGSCTSSSNAANLSSIALNTAGTIAYVVEGQNSGSVGACAINGDGSYGSCPTIVSGNVNAFNFAIAIPPGSLYAYLGGRNFNGNLDYINACVINNDGTFGSCNTVATFSVNTFLFRETQLALTQ